MFILSGPGLFVYLYQRTTLRRTIKGEGQAKHNDPHVKPPNVIDLLLNGMQGRQISRILTDVIACEKSSASSPPPDTKSVAEKFI